MRWGWAAVGYRPSSWLKLRVGDHRPHLLGGGGRFRFRLSGLRWLGIRGTVSGVLSCLPPSGVCMAPSVGSVAETLPSSDSGTGPPGSLPLALGRPYTNQVGLMLSASQRNGGKILRSLKLNKIGENLF